MSDWFTGPQPPGFFVVMAILCVAIGVWCWRQESKR